MKKMKLSEFDLENGLGLGLLGIGFIVTLMTNKKEALSRDKMKKEILEEVMNNIPKKD